MSQDTITITRSQFYAWVSSQRPTEDMWDSLKEFVSKTPKQWTTRIVEAARAQGVNVLSISRNENGAVVRFAKEPTWEVWSAITAAVPEFIPGTDLNYEVLP